MPILIEAFMHRYSINAGHEERFLDMGGLTYTPEQELDEFVSFCEQGTYRCIVQQDVQVSV